MSDFLMELGQNPMMRSLVKNLGLPLPMPEKLARGRGPYTERPLDDKDVVCGAGPEPLLLNALAKIVTQAGANPLLFGEGALELAFADLGEAYGRPASRLAEPREGRYFHALVFDASGITTPAGLRSMYDFFHPLVRSLGRCGRFVVLGRDPAECKAAADAAAQAALEGFIRSAAKEIGKKGATANLIRVAKGAEDRLDGALRFILGPRSAFVDGQPLTVTKLVKTKVDPTWVLPLEGKIALVTGAARGIGKATATRLAEEGAHVICLDRPDDAPLAEAVAKKIGGSVLLADMAAEDTPDAIATYISEKHGGVDIVVHNAGVTRDRTLGKMDEGRWELTLTINLAALANTTRALREAGLLNKDGRVVCLSSIAGIAGNMGQTNYAASKAGVIGLVQNLSAQLAKQGVTVNAVAPGFIETRMTAAVPMVIREAGRRLSSLGQGGQPVDVAEAITFLTTPGASGLTGQVLRVCGGGFIGA